ncbi:hypothetical protein [Azotobacter chroococcum]|uniref:hypothetical protein n=1 Tax=Azotobacter chroococcum TaxID=353 RepID=UPI0010ADA77B|nr:hypothetical protein [Azotobacter chroococcum]TKD46456.1 hypothetical protein FCG41_02050 [Azotobacter chroococcum]
MQYAYCLSDKKVWEALEFSQLKEIELDEKRNNLFCTECNALAWFRKESRNGHPAHFCAHHEPDCQLKAEYVVVDADKGDASEEVDQIQSSGDIIVHLDKEQGGDIDITSSTEIPGGGSWQQGRTHVIRGNDRFSNQEFTLKRILYRLVQSPDFRHSRGRITFFRKKNEIYIDGKVCDVTRAFSEMTATDDDQTKFYWGPITSAARTMRDGKIWLNSSPQYQSVSVVIFEDIADAFLKAFNISDLDELTGAHVLVSGKCMYSGKNKAKPIIWCGALHQIVIRRYRAAYLQPAG